MKISWDPVAFCGINPPSVLDSVSYSIEIAEGIEWKENVMARYINDVLISPTSYRTVATETYTTECVIPNLKPATWYHLRLCIEYLGVRVISETANIHTTRSAPSAPAMPKATVMSVRSSFDLVSQVPARYELMITWNSSIANGSDIERYQVQMQRLDSEGNVLSDDPPVTTFRSSGRAGDGSNPDNRGRGEHSHQFMNEMKAIALLTMPNMRQSNQWTSSPGKSELQIRHCLQSRGKSVSLDARKPPPSPSSSRKSSKSQKEKRTRSPSLHGDSTASSSASWRIIYDNFHRTVRLGAPRPQDAMWRMRVRAKNAVGWSPFSSVLELSAKTHASLFQSRLTNPPPLSLTSAGGSMFLGSQSHDPLIMLQSASFGGQDQSPSQQQSDGPELFPDLFSPPVSPHPSHQHAIHVDNRNRNSYSISNNPSNSRPGSSRLPNISSVPQLSLDDNTNDNNNNSNNNMNSNSLKSASSVDQRHTFFIPASNPNYEAILASHSAGAPSNFMFERPSMIGTLTNKPNASVYGNTATGAYDAYGSHDQQRQQHRVHLPQIDH